MSEGSNSNQLNHAVILTLFNLDTICNYTIAYRKVPTHLHLFNVIFMMIYDHCNYLSVKCKMLVFLEGDALFLGQCLCLCLSI